MNKFVFFIVLLSSVTNVFSETVMGIEAPECWGKPIENEEQVKCIAFFMGSFQSTLFPHGKEFDVVVKKENEFWYVYPKTPSKDVPKEKVLYKISATSGKPVGWSTQ